MFLVVRTLLYSSKSEFIKMENNFHPDAIIIGSGLAGLVAAMEITNAGKKVLLLDQETEQNIGGQAFWSFGGLLDRKSVV